MFGAVFFLFQSLFLCRQPNAPALHRPWNILNICFDDIGLFLFCAKALCAVKKNGN